jgi:hypothetical protein
VSKITGPPGAVSTSGAPQGAPAPDRPTSELPSAGDKLRLKWGTLKGWDGRSEPFRAALQKYADAGGMDSVSAMQARDTPEQKELLCEVIDAVDGKITNDWTGERMTKDEAKKYVREYGQ